MCVFIVIHIYMCILLYTSFQTLGSTHVWLPAQAVKHRGVLSWRSKVQDGIMIPRVLLTETLSAVFTRESIFFLIPSLHSESGGVMVMKNHDENELPGPPSKPQVTDVTKNSVSLSWQPGMAGASPVSSYVIEAFRFV